MQKVKGLEEAAVRIVDPMVGRMNNNKRCPMKQVAWLIGYVRKCAYSSWNTTSMLIKEIYIYELYTVLPGTISWKHVTSIVSETTTPMWDLLVPKSEYLVVLNCVIFVTVLYIRRLRWDICFPEGVA